MRKIRDKASTIILRDDGKRWKLGWLGGNEWKFGWERKQEGEKIDRKHGSIAAGSNRGNLGSQNRGGKGGDSKAYGKIVKCSLRC